MADPDHARRADPVSDTLRTTGTTDLIGDWLSGFAGTLPPWGAVALILAASMAGRRPQQRRDRAGDGADRSDLRHGPGLSPEAFLMATAVWRGCDFLPPIGHQCNTLVMGPGGYRFGDCPAGAPLSLLVLLVVPLLILWAWPV